MEEITHPQSAGYIGPDDISENAPQADELPALTCPPDYVSDPHINLGDHP